MQGTAGDRTDPRKVGNAEIMKFFYLIPTCNNRVRSNIFMTVPQLQSPKSKARNQLIQQEPKPFEVKYFSSHTANTKMMITIREG
jgi:hypothetical protein